VTCAIGAVVSFLRYDSKHFDLLVLSGVIFLSAAIPSFEVDASLEVLKSINHRLITFKPGSKNANRIDRAFGLARSAPVRLTLLDGPLGCSRSTALFTRLNAEDRMLACKPSTCLFEIR
jgi:hypothetical protein